MQKALHSHPQEQWSILIEGSAIRFMMRKLRLQRVIFAALAIPNMGLLAGPEGALIIDIFAPARPEYIKAGKGFASHSAQHLGKEAFLIASS